MEQRDDQHLRRTMRDLVALSTLPAIWIGQGPDGIARSLANALFNTLSLDLIYVRLAGRGGAVVEVVRSSHSSEPDHDARVRAAIAPLLQDLHKPPATLADPFGSDPLPIAVTRFGISDDHGVIVAGSHHAEFPTEQDRLLLSVGANQTAVVIQRWHSEQQAYEQQEWLRVTLASIGDAVVATDTDGRVTFLNSVARQLTGWAESDAEGKPLSAILQLIDEQKRRPIADPVEPVLRDGAVNAIRGQTILVSKDGVERNIDASAAPIKNLAGAVLGVVLTIRDVTEQRRAERRTRRSESASRYLAQASAELASVVDYEATLQKVTALAVPFFADWAAVDVASEGGLRRLAVTHQDAKKVELAHELMREYPPDPQAAGGMPAVLRSGKPEMVTEITDAMLVSGAKDERHLQLIRALGLKSYICVPLAVSGDIIGALTFATAESGRHYTDADLALAMDLAHRAAVAVENTKLYQALRDADRRKDEFLATLAHELRNPLAPIRNALEILKMPRVEPETLERSRAMMERQVHHIVRLVDDLLDVSRVMGGKIELRREPVELATIIARAVETVQPLIDAQQHHLSISLPPESLLLEADAVRLSQVISNLLANAAKYTDRGGRIWLTTERDGDSARVRVRDSGIGIEPAMRARIFDLFVQVDHATTRSQGGLGIGLTLAKNLVEMHNGSIEAHSAGLGRGTEFVVRLPVLPDGATADRLPATHAGGRSEIAPSGARLLVVDDNRDAASSLAMVLRAQGHDVRVAFSGPAALEMAKESTPDLVFLDIGMPGMDGYEVARRMRQQPGLERVVLAALTGWGQQEDRRRSAEAGFDHHLVKPPEPATLETLVSSTRAARAARAN